MSDRKILLRVSRDGGHTWGNWCEHTLGELGEYRTRIRFRRFGLARDIRVQVRKTSALRVNVHGCVVDWDVGE